MFQPIDSLVNNLIKKHDLDCYILFNSDSHLNEYIGEKDQLVAEISGFIGSNATVVISKDPILLTDSRYYIQAQAQSKFPLYKETLTSYIEMKKYKRISFDTRTISSTRFTKLKECIDTIGAVFVPTELNLSKNTSDDKKELINIEKLQLDTYIKLKNNVLDEGIVKYLNMLGFTKFNVNISGTSYKDKISKIRMLIKNSCLVVSEMDTICWILNLRGDDIMFNPLFYSYLIITSQEIILFCNKTIELEDITVKPYESFDSYLDTLNVIEDMAENTYKEVFVSSECNQFIYSKLKNVKLTKEIRKMQACKNETELCGMALAYFFDGIALTELFSFINNTNGLTEKDIANKLHEIKTKFSGYVQPSFETISSTGTNAAIVHHKAGDTKVDKEQVYLLDCGSQYYFGTTDTTRTLFYGNTVPDVLKHDYTLVLKGQINAMMMNYPNSSLYSQIDDISRSFLKSEQKDFGHATGHGVGHFLCVHEHPPTVHPKANDEIEENHVFSVEPGYYKENEYGIRIENLVVSKKILDGISLLNITLVPYQNKMIDVDMLTKTEREYYNMCNKRCIDVLSPFLSEDAKKWINENSAELK